MAKQRNARLEALLLEFGYTHQQLADEVNRIAEALLGKPRMCTDRHVRRWVAGDVQWPWAQYLLLLQEIFGRSPEAMGFVPRGKSSRVPSPPRRPTPMRHDHALGGGALHTVATEALHRVRDAVNRCSYGERVEKQLYAAVGDLAASAGWFAYDAGHQREATTLYNEALQAAILARDGSLQARVWSNLAMQARLLGRDQEAVRIGRAQWKPGRPSAIRGS
ncbi:hypothetical protein [Streptomyces himastatinicus]|nr:hypothetical protein [Streptomyces himastatinicus]